MFISKQSACHIGCYPSGFWIKDVLILPQTRPLMSDILMQCWTHAFSKVVHVYLWVLVSKHSCYCCWISLLPSMENSITLMITNTLVWMYWLFQFSGYIWLLWFMFCCFRSFRSGVGCKLKGILSTRGSDYRSVLDWSIRWDGQCYCCCTTWPGGCT
jgi:hypothetical protein